MSVTESDSESCGFHNPPKTRCRFKNFFAITSNGTTIVSLALMGCILIFSATAFAAPSQNRNSASIEGEVQVLHIDEFEKGKSSTVYFLRDSKTGRMTELAFANNVPRGLRTGEKIIVHGRAVGNKFEVDEMVAGLQDEPSTEEESAGVAEAGTGIHHAIVMILNMSDAPGEATYPSADNPDPLYFNDSHIGQVQGTMFSNSYSVDSVYQEASYNQLSFPDSMGNNVVLLNIPYSAGCSYYTIATNADNAATAAGIYLGAYHNKMYLVPPRSISDCSWLALGEVGGYGSSSTRRAWSTRNDTVAFLHEFGHNLGWHHSATDPENDGTTNSEYGDTSGIMGYCCGHKKFNSVHVDQIGWYDSPELADSVVRVLSSGTYTIAPLNSDPNNIVDPMILKIDKPDSSETYFLSFRKKVGLDSSLSSSYTTGVNIHRGRETGNWSYLIDVLDNGSGNQFMDTNNGIIITQRASTTDYVTVDISFGLCATQSPSVAMGPVSQTLGNLSDTLLPYTVTVTNNDTQGCESSTFDLAFDSVTNIFGTLQSTSVSLLPGESDSIQLDVQVGDVADQTYALNVQMSDASQSNHSAQGSANLQIDTTSPDSPSTLSAGMKKVKGQQSVELTWSSATDPSPGTGVDMYKVYRDNSWIADVSNTRYVDPNYNSGGTTHYEVYTVDQAKHVSSTPVSTSFTDNGSSWNKGKGGGKSNKKK